MQTQILLTSFQTWLPHQHSNSSDDLLGAIESQLFPNFSLRFLRQLPVDIEKSSRRAIAQIDRTHPNAILCCGMAETRNTLTVESTAWRGNKSLQTTLSLDSIVANLSATEISHDAGKFVCEGLYYEVLNHIQHKQLPISCLFIHVPLLTPHNFSMISADFCQLLDRVAKLRF
ncbi:peptidase C15 [Lusitaniella coriacea LEGE 07157]|uniref:Peptidase C15 n=1 Tax=Lusitaniella coriacea LEGE 07157 TaxID=945747 RepID=A0A8J7JCX2_9CYAN|nr:peptidase C15 [Lusitaniella coriacea]MBE9117735.1 peptidase C15 [Lusitaniella coriacea LEGE 07157]